MAKGFNEPAKLTGEEHQRIFEAAAGPSLLSDSEILERGKVLAFNIMRSKLVQVS